MEVGFHVGGVIHTRGVVSFEGRGDVDEVETVDVGGVDDNRRHAEERSFFDEAFHQHRFPGPRAGKYRDMLPEFEEGEVYRVALGLAADDPPAQGKVGLGGLRLGVGGFRDRRDGRGFRGRRWRRCWRPGES